MKKRHLRLIIYILTVVILCATVLPVHSNAEEQTTAAKAETAAEEKSTEEKTAKETTAAVPVNGITLEKTAEILRAGSSVVLNATVTPEDATNKKINWESSDENIARVSEDGKVTALRYGTATITGTTDDGGFAASCELKVLFFDLGEVEDNIYAPLYWAVDQSIISPETGALFLPKSTCTRGAAVNYLYNLMEKPEYSNGTDFKDVAKDSPMYDAVSWAEENGLLEGIAEKDLFAAGKSCRKEELALLLYRLKGTPYVGYDGLFTDVKDGSKFKDAINWAVENNVIDDYREPDGSTSYYFGSEDRLTKEDAAIFLYNYTHESNAGFTEDFFANYTFPVLMNGMEVPEDIYQKYSNPEYCAEVFAHYALQEGWQYEAVVGALAYMWVEGMSAKGTFTYEGCWTVTGPAGAIQDRTLNNSAWREWIHSENCAVQMIAHSSYYSNAHYAVGLGYCGESNAWNASGGRWKQMLNRCDAFLTAADMSGVAWQDINFQTHHALSTITSCTYDPDFRNPTTFTGDAREYCARVFASVGYTGFSVWYDNGQLGPHLAAVDTVRPFVDAVINHTSIIEEDLNAEGNVFIPF